VKPNRNQLLILMWTFALGVAVSYQPPALAPIPVVGSLADETGTGIIVIGEGDSRMLVTPVVVVTQNVVETVIIRHNPRNPFEVEATEGSPGLRCFKISESWRWDHDGRRPVTKLSLSPEDFKCNKRSSSNLISQ
jgi:hypothetical protein